MCLCAHAMCVQTETGVLSLSWEGHPGQSVRDCSRQEQMQEARRGDTDSKRHRLLKVKGFLVQLCQPELHSWARRGWHSCNPNTRGG